MSAVSAPTVDRAIADASPVLHLTGEATPVRRLVAEFVRARALLLMLARHDFQARYRSASLGLAWSVLLPLIQGAVLAIVFTRIVKIDAGVNYPIFILSGTTAWAYLSQSVTAGSTAIVDRGDIATKIYFPRMLLPAVPALAGGVSLMVSLAVALVLVPVFGAAAHVTLLLLPVAAVALAVLAILVAEICALLHVYFRDVRYLVTAIILVAFYATPIIYPLSRAKHLTGLVSANPATGVMQLVRFCFFGRAAGGLLVPLMWTCGWAIALTLAILAGFARYERVACDRL